MLDRSRADHLPPRLACVDAAAARSSTCTFPGEDGTPRTARLDLPIGPVRASAVFAHCFTCSKDLRVERQLTAALAACGIAVLSFDFTGLSHGGRDLREGGFAADVADLRAAAQHLASTLVAPSLLVGHSLGGAAVLSAAPDIPGVRAVATIGAPADPAHVEHVLDGDLESVRRDGSGSVTIAGRRFQVSRRFLDQLEHSGPVAALARFRGAVLLLHSPVDETVGVDNAEVLFKAARHPRSFVSLDTADHLVTDAAWSAYAASVISAWAGRYLPDSPGVSSVGDGGASAINHGGFATAVRAGSHDLLLDEPVAVGGGDLGPTPYDLLSAALAACSAMTMRSYAERKGWDVGALTVSVDHDRVHASDCQACETSQGVLQVFQRHIDLPVGLTAEQAEALVRIADRCPVHRVLEGQVEVHTDAGVAPGPAPAPAPAPAQE